MAKLQEQSNQISKEEARKVLELLQTLVGIAFVSSALIGIYLLLTDGSLWLLAISHALGLVVIVIIDSILGTLNLLARRNAYVPSLAAAVLGLLLQGGDVFTAPQYHMTILYFASYLYQLWTFDLLLTLQASVILIGVAGRRYAGRLTKMKTRGGGELNYSKRAFIRAVVGFAGAVGFAVVVGSVEIPTHSFPISPPPQTSSSVPPKSAIANTNTLKVGSPIYFEYPSGYPNMLLKRADGSLIALSMLCTHVCCDCIYDSANDVIGCPCHGSVFDLGGQVLQGPAVTPLPSVELTVDSAGYVIPTSIRGSSPCIQA